MRIRDIHLYRIRIPFKKAFRHALSERSATDNIVVETRLEDGAVGYGEGLPREYVTGETPEGVIASLRNLPPSLFQSDFKSLGELVEFLDSEILSRKYFKQDRENNTARSVLELSLTDAYCRSFKTTFGHVAQEIIPDLPERTGSPVYYDGVVSLGNRAESLWNAVKMKLFGFRRIKVKAGTDDEHLFQTLKVLRRIAGGRVDIRIDVNGAWNLEHAASTIPKLLPFSVSAIEQPLPHSQLFQMKDLKQKSPIPLMLDESLCTLEDARRAIDNKLCDLFNIRLSKCGGFINSLKMARLARQHGIGYQLGCMVGETGILSAAGRQFATLDPQLRYLEGSYDRYLLKDNVTREEISFKRQGRALGLDGCGLGVSVDREKLKRYAVLETTLPG